MSIASEITNYANGLSDAYGAVNDMQGIIPQDKNMNNLDTAIRTIPQNLGPTYTAGDGIDITNDVISATNTGKMKELTSADYNWPEDNPNGVALWKLDNGFYHVDNVSSLSIKVYAYSGDSSVYTKANTFLVTDKPQTANTKSIYVFGGSGSDANGSNLVRNYSVNAVYGTSTGDVLAALTTSEVIDNLISYATKLPLSANKGRELKELIDSLATKGSGAPTASTVGTVGKLYEDTTNGKLYQCTAIDTTDPQNPSYTWTEVGTGGGGSGVIELTSADYNYPENNPTSIALWLLNEGIYKTGEQVSVRFNLSSSANIPQGQSFLVLKKGGSTARTLVLMQNVSSTPPTIWVTNSSNGNSIINEGTFSMLSDFFADANKERVKIGYASQSTANCSVALGAYSSASTQGEVSLGGDGLSTYGYNNTKYRLLTNVYDGQSAHDAATKGQLDSIAIKNAGAPTSATVGTVGQLLEDTTNGKLYICTDATNPYVWTEIGAVMTGATSSVAGTAGLVPAPTTSDTGKYLKGDGTWGAVAPELVEMSYGESNAWSKFIAAYNAKSIVYCRASSNSNPASGAQTRKAFMAYVNNATNPTTVEFQYVRSQSSKSDSQQCDQVFVYKLTDASGGTWSVETRDMATKINVDSTLNKTYSSGANASMTLGAKAMTGATSSTAGTAGYVPAPMTSDVNRFLKGDGTWAPATVVGYVDPNFFRPPGGLPIWENTSQSRAYHAGEIRDLLENGFQFVLAEVNNGTVVSTTQILYSGDDGQGGFGALNFWHNGAPMAALALVDDHTWEVS